MGVDGVVGAGVDVDAEDEGVGGLRQSMSTCAWREVMRVTRASTPDVTSGWRGGARGIVGSESVDADVGVDIFLDELIVSEDDVSSDIGSLVPTGSTDIINFEAT